MNTFAAAALLLILMWITGCEVKGPSIKVKGPTVEIPDVEVGAENGGKFCPPGQAKKGRC
ncbi:MAG: hypothetical protein D6690_16195 [Nitrospirae bacterium]|nr:MAG: hypothetical protein D6690_16195 [Nitrospirota bacterium]